MSLDEQTVRDLAELEQDLERALDSDPPSPDALEQLVKYVERLETQIARLNEIT